MRKHWINWIQSKEQQQTIELLRLIKLIRAWSTSLDLSPALFRVPVRFSRDECLSQSSQNGSLNQFFVVTSVRLERGECLLNEIETSRFTDDRLAGLKYSPRMSQSSNFFTKLSTVSISILFSICLCNLPTLWMWNFFCQKRSKQFYLW